MLWALTGLVAGLFAGRLANFFVDRLPRDAPFKKAIFACPHCGARDRAIESLPIAGWFATGGRCWACRKPVSWRVPAVEALTALLWMAIGFYFGPSLRGLVLTCFATSLLVLSAIDLEHRLLPDIITLPGVIAGVLATWIPGWPVTLLDSALSAALGYFGMMALAKAAAMYYREEALGQGDWKLVAMIGAFLGSKLLIAVVLIGNIMGALIGLQLVIELGDAGRQKLPLGTFLGTAAIFMIFA